MYVYIIYTVVFFKGNNLPTPNLCVYIYTVFFIRQQTIKKFITAQNQLVDDA